MKPANVEEFEVRIRYEWKLIFRQIISYVQNKFQLSLRFWQDVNGMDFYCYWISQQNRWVVIKKIYDEFISIFANSLYNIFVRKSATKIEMLNSALSQIVFILHNNYL